MDESLFDYTYEVSCISRPIKAGVLESAIRDMVVADRGDPDSGRAILHETLGPKTSRSGRVKLADLGRITDLCQVDVTLIFGGVEHPLLVELAGDADTVEVSCNGKDAEEARRRVTTLIEKLGLEVVP